MFRLVVTLFLVLTLPGCEQTEPPVVSSESETNPSPETSVGKPYDYAQVSLPPEQLRGQALSEPQPHWVWVMDPMLNAMPDGRAYLIDGAAGRILGMLNTGYSFVSLSLPPAYDWIYAAETYYSRHTRGERTDVVSVYNRNTLAPVEEIVIPTKRASTIPRLSNAAVTDDGRFMMVYNFTPAPSVSIVDLVNRSFVYEAQIPGCAMIYPTGPRQFFSLCGDGRILVLTLDDSGKVQTRFNSEPFYSLDDPITEAGVRYEDRWIFASADGEAYEVAVGADSVTVVTWPLISSGSQNRWIGGMQHLAVHEARGELYSVTHEGAQRDYEAAGDEVWVYDIDARSRVRVLELAQPANSILVSQDPEPLLFVLPLANELDIYDAVSGELKHSMSEIGLTPMLMATPLGVQR